jgi:hypothetical protein
MEDVAGDDGLGTALRAGEIRELQRAPVLGIGDAERIAGEIAVGHLTSTASSPREPPGSGALAPDIRAARPEPRPIEDQLRPRA